MLGSTEQFTLAVGSFMNATTTTTTTTTTTKTAFENNSKPKNSNCILSSMVSGGAQILSRGLMEILMPKIQHFVEVE